jgi:hypothetical protein
MPKWGNINERRNQLHEVIRLSGMNLIIDDTDHPLKGFIYQPGDYSLRSFQRDV